MRALLLAGLALAGCDPIISPGAYLCGPEELCPEGQVCNGPDNTCVLPEAREDFACAADPERPPAADDTPATGIDLGELGCVSIGGSAGGCLDAADRVDWYQFDVPSACTAVEVIGRVTFPIAFQPVGVRFADAGGAPVAVESDCDATSVAAGLVARCYEMVLEPGGHYAIGVERDGDDCDGGCPYNRYSLELRLKTP